MQFDLNPAEGRLLLQVVNFCLNTQFSRRPQPEFASVERARLESLFAEPPFISGGPAGGAPFDLLLRCLNAFDGEVGSSPFEVAALTGVPYEAYVDLSARLRRPFGAPSD